MGLFDKLKKAFENGSGKIGEAPSEEFPTQIGLIRTALERHFAMPAEDGHWLSLEISDEQGRKRGVVQLAGEQINLCDRDDVDVGTLLSNAGRHDMAKGVRREGEALVRIEGASRDDLALAIDVIIVGGLGATDTYRVRAEING